VMVIRGTPPRPLSSMNRLLDPPQPRLTQRAGSIRHVFPDLVRSAGLQHACRRRPRPHDLRHSFAVRTLLGWYRAGVNVEAHMPLLSTYLGHSDPKDTYWYLSAVPELLFLAAERLERAEQAPS
jgi:integrase/recombinase XerD